jgi:dihydroxy-acid dehydratase
MRARPATSSRSRSNLPGRARPRMRIPGDSARMTETCVDSRLRGNDGYGEETPMPNGKKPTAAQIKKLRSRQWFDNPDNPDMTASPRALRRTSREEPQQPIISKRPVGSTCAVQPPPPDGAARAQGIRRPAASPSSPGAPDPDARAPPSDRNLAHPGPRPLRLSIDLACYDRLRQDHALAADGRRDSRPAGHRVGRPMLSGWFRGERTGSGTMWKARQMFATGDHHEQFVSWSPPPAPSPPRKRWAWRRP